MIFYRGTPKDASTPPMNVKRVRILSTLALFIYPIGAVIALVGGLYSQNLVQVSGLLLIFVAVFAFIGIVGSGVQRIAGEENQKLDPLELELRQRTYARAYHWVGAIMLLAILYLGVATDTQEKIGLWVPSTFDHWSAIMWGGILLVTVLPTALLAWSLPTEEFLEDDV